MGVKKLTKAIIKAFTANRVKRLLNFLEQEEEGSKLTKNEQKQYEETKKYLYLRAREVRLYSTLRTISFLVLYAGLITSFFKTSIIISVIQDTAAALTGALGTTVFLGIIGMTTFFINNRVVDSMARAAKATALLNKRKAI